MSDQSKITNEKELEEVEQSSVPMWASCLGLVVFMVGTVIAILTLLGPQIGNVFSRQLVGLQ